MSSPLWPTALSPVADGDVAVRTCSRNTSFQRADSFSSTRPSSAPHYPGVCTPKASRCVLPFALHLCEIPTAGNCCINATKSFLLSDFVAEQAVSMSIRVKAGSWRLRVSSLQCHRETRSACSSDCLLKGEYCKFRSGTNRSCELQNWFQSCI